MQFKPMMVLVATGLVAPLHGLIANTAEHKMTREEPWVAQGWKHDCFKRVNSYKFGLLQLEDHNPGAGMQPDQIAPFQTVLKDGFMKVACVKDAMYEHGDKYGNNKFQYKMGPIANSSIVHYTDIIAKEDRAKMTPAVCFEFCRGIPDMGYFGISNGRDCYCTPYFEAMASDSSNCDSVCEGDNGQLCGGKTKNSIFGMHSCDDTVEELKGAVTKAEAVEHHLEETCGGILSVSKSVESAALSMQKSFGSIGDPGASNQMQSANQRAGELLHGAEKCLEFTESVKSALSEASTIEPDDLKDYKKRKAAEDDIAALGKASKEGTEMLTARVKEWQTIQPSMGSAERQASTFLPHVLDQYYSIMYFADREYADDEKFPVSCDGDLIGEPALGLDAGHCAAACDELVGQCVGFAAYELHNGEEDAAMCFLFSKFKTAQYYTGCDKAPASNFLQHRSAKTDHKDAILGWATRHKHAVHINLTATQKAECAARKTSATCGEAKQGIHPDGTESDTCYLAPDNTWKFDDLPGYFNCLNACCEDYNPNLMLDGLTCKDLMGYAACPDALEVSNPPEGTKIETVCPSSCGACDGPVTTMAPTTTVAPVIPTKAPVLVTNIPEKTPPQKELKTEIKAMCRAKLSRFGSVSLKPDPEGKNQFALKELTKADRCFD